MVHRGTDVQRSAHVTAHNVMLANKRRFQKREGTATPCGGRASQCAAPRCVALTLEARQQPRAPSKLRGLWRCPNVVSLEVTRMYFCRLAATRQFRGRGKIDNNSGLHYFETVAWGPKPINNRQDGGASVRRGDVVRRDARARSRLGSAAAAQRGVGVGRGGDSALARRVDAAQSPRREGDAA